MEESTHLSKIVKHVTVVHRRDTLRASKIMQERAFKDPKIRFLWDTVVDEIVGNDKGLTGASLRHVKTGKPSELKANGLFLAIGHQPTTALVQGVLDLTPPGYSTTAP